MKILGLSFLAFIFAQMSFASEPSTVEVFKIEATSATTLDNVKPSNWKFSLESEFYMNQQEQKDKGSDATLTSYHVASGKYAYDKETAFKLVPTFEINYIPLENDRAQDVKDELANDKKFNGARIADPYVGIVKTKGSLWKSDTMKTELRYYMPFSEVSAEKKSAGTMRLDYTLPWTVGNWNLAYYLNPRMKFVSGESDARTALHFHEYAVGTYNFSDAVSSYVMVGHQLLSDTSDFLTNQETVYAFEFGATANFSKNIAVTLYLDNFFTDGKDDIALFSASKNEFVLATSLNF